MLTLCEVSNNAMLAKFECFSECYASFQDKGASIHAVLHIFLQVIHVINIGSTKFSMDDKSLEADTEYAARVRSSPNQVLYQGQWSDWSPEVHWRTESVKNGESPCKKKQLFIYQNV